MNTPSSNVTSNSRAGSTATFQGGMSGSAFPGKGQDNSPAPSNGRPAADGAPRTRQQAQRYSQATLTPPVDVLEDSSGITLYADLPGVPRENLKLQVEADTLTIEAEAALNLPEGLQSSHTEVGLARFHRVFTLSKELDIENVSAELAQGVLKLRIPKAAHAQPRRISISAG